MPWSRNLQVVFQTSVNSQRKCCYGVSMCLRHRESVKMKEPQLPLCHWPDGGSWVALPCGDTLKNRHPVLRATVNHGEGSMEEEVKKPTKRGQVKDTMRDPSSATSKAEARSSHHTPQQPCSVRPLVYLARKRREKRMQEDMRIFHISISGSSDLESMLTTGFTDGRSQHILLWKVL